MPNKKQESNNTTDSSTIALQALYKEDAAPMCQHDGCQSAGIKCTIDFLDEKTNEFKEQVEYYCPEHAAEYGFCSCCGGFIAGIDDLKTICEVCEDQLRADFGEYDNNEFNKHDNDFD